VTVGAICDTAVTVRVTLFGLRVTVRVTLADYAKPIRNTRAGGGD
jgi:hypothetical protein